MRQFRALFACNDERGEFTGTCALIEIGDDTTDTLVTMQGDLDAPDPIVFDSTHLRFGPTTDHCRVAYYKRGHNVGNVHWDACTIDEIGARFLVETAYGLGWQCTQHALSGPLVATVKAHEARRPRKTAEET